MIVLLLPGWLLRLPCALHWLVLPHTDLYRLVLPRFACHLQHEQQLLRMLDEVRQGGFGLETQQLLRKLARELPMVDGILPTKLYPTNAGVSDVPWGCCSCAD